MTPHAFHDLPPEAFPFTLLAFRCSDDEQVWSMVVAEAPVVLKIPPLSVEHGPIWMRFAYGNGETYEDRTFCPDTTQ